MDASRRDGATSVGGGGPGVAGDDGRDRLLASIIELSMDAVICTDAEHRVTLFNRGAERVFGHERDQILGRPVFRLVPERHRGAHARYLRRFAEVDESSRTMGGRKRIVGLRKDGEEFPAEASISTARVDGDLVFTVVLRDASAAVKAEEARREAEERWRRMADALPIHLASVDAEERIVFVNRALANWVGAPRDEVVGRTVKEVAGEPTYSEIQRHVRAALEGAGQRFRTETETDDGEVRAYDVVFEPYGTEAGAVHGYFLASLDITERTRMERRLHRRSRAIEALHGIGSHPSLTLDEKIDGLLALGCDHFDLDLGVFARVDGEAWTVRRVHPESSAIQRGDTFPIEGTLCARAIEASGPMSYDEEVDGGAETYPAYPAEALGRYLGVPVVVGGESYGVLSFTRLRPRGVAFDPFDVNLIRLMARWLGSELERKAVLEGQELLVELGRVLAGSLHETEVLEACVELALPELGDGCVVYALRPDGPVRVTASHVDPELRETLGALPEGSLVQDGGPHPVLAALRTGKPYLDVPGADERDGRPCLADEVWDGFPGGACRALLVAPLVGRRGVLGAIVFFSADAHRYSGHDVTIAREFAARCTSALENASLLKEARSAVAARDEVLSMVSHDLGSPLSSVSMSVDHLRSLAAKGGDMDDFVSYLDGMKDATARMEGLVEDLLAVEVLAGRGEAVADGEVEAAEVLRAAARELRPRFEAGSLGLEIITDTEAPVAGNRDQVLRVLVNLLDNAAKFTGPGGRVELGAERSGEGVHFFVADTGKGISQERLDRIFDRYAQAREERRAGAGLGLAIVKKTVESYGGRVWVESELGVGSTFHFILPES